MSGIPHTAIHHNQDLLKQSEPDYHHSVIGTGKDVFAIERNDRNAIMPNVILTKNVSGQHLEKLDGLCVHLNSRQFHTRLNALRTIDMKGWANLASTLLLQKYEHKATQPEFRGCPPKLRWTPTPDERCRPAFVSPFFDERLVNKVIINSSEDAKRFLEGDWKVERPEIRNDREPSKPVTVEVKVDRNQWAKAAEEVNKFGKEIREAQEKAFRTAARNMHEQMVRRTMGMPEQAAAMQCHPAVITTADIANALGEHGHHINWDALSEEDTQALTNHLAHTNDPIELIKKWVMETGSSISIESFGRALATMQGDKIADPAGILEYGDDPVEADDNVVTTDESCDGGKAFDILKTLCR